MKARLFRAETVPWVEPPEHYGGFSKYLVGPGEDAGGGGSKYFDFRVSLYGPKGYVDPHVHGEAEQVYYILQGTGLMELDGEQHLVEPHTTIFIPPGVRHAIANTGFENLMFVVVTSPPGDIPR